MYCIILVIWTRINNMIYKDAIYTVVKCVVTCKKKNPIINLREMHFFS